MRVIIIFTSRFVVRLLFIQRSAGIFYIVIILIYLLTNENQNKLKKIFNTVAICNHLFNSWIS